MVVPPLAGDKPIYGAERTYWRQLAIGAIHLPGGQPESSAQLETIENRNRATRVDFQCHDRPQAKRPSPPGMNQNAWSENLGVHPE